MKFIACALLILVVACQNKPTKVSESTPNAWTARITETTKKPLKLTDDTVVLDSRSEFDYGLAHWSSSVHFDWRTLVQDPKKPWLLVDKLTAQKRLGLLGIRPRTPVVVIGYGPKGKGEEGRLAWLLLYYGIDDVQTVSVNGLDVYFTHQDSAPRINSEAWDTPVRDQFLIDRNQFINAAMSNRKSGVHTIHIIDVRSKDEYFNKNVQYETPDLRALQIDVHEFFTEDGRPAKSVRSKLRGIGVKMDDEVIILSSDSVRSSAAAYSLLALGFKNVRNFLGGWESLVKKH